MPYACRRVLHRPAVDVHHIRVGFGIKPSFLMMTRQYSRTPHCRSHPAVRRSRRDAGPSASTCRAIEKAAVPGGDRGFWRVLSDARRRVTDRPSREQLSVPTGREATYPAPGRRGPLPLPPMGPAVPAVVLIKRMDSYKEFDQPLRSRSTRAKRLGKALLMTPGMRTLAELTHLFGIIH